MTTQDSALRYEPAGEDGIGVLWFDCPGKKVNTLSVDLIDQVGRVLSAAKADTRVRAIVIASAKKSGFIAGADIDDLGDVTSAAEGTKLSASGQKAMDGLSGLGMPTVAAIHGDCLGGGLELALACTARIASSDKRTKMALPEVMLGLLPGAGGTQRLPKLVGLTAALDMMLTGKNIRSAKALKMGLIDRMVPHNQLLSQAKRFAGELADGKAARRPRKKKLQDRILEDNPIGRQVVFSAARKKVLGQTKGLYPAPIKILEAVQAGTYEAESRGFGELLMSDESASLRHLFHCITALKKDNGPDTEGVEPREVRHVGMLGAGLMGAGIATVLADKGVTVRLKDLSDDALSSAYKYAKKVYAKARRRKRYGTAGLEERSARISGGLDYSGFGHAEIVIEAVLEDMDLKRKMVADIEAATRSEAIFATNTSALPIAEIAAEAKHPERVIGMHFFSPVEKMPLVEIIVHDGTDPVVTATTCAVARKMGKHVIVVRDCPGFYTTRALAPYMVEAITMVFEGYRLEDIDQAATQVGFPVGPITLMDEVGIDVGAKVLKTMRAAYGERMQIPDSAMTDAFLAEGRMGRKASKGFYVYENGESKLSGGKKIVDPGATKHLSGYGAKRPDLDLMGDRLVLALVNEAAHCLEEGILREPMAGDLGAIMGIGFPPMLGGPLFHADVRGVDRVVVKLQEYAQSYGKRFEPSALLVRHAEAGTKIHG
ncbi:MAG: fatty acid oxidation complex subunit alpha FadJ [Deltaproteobacteria bacterium]|nr:fatty acid oxidation complex subunit alpha FadJ [Deltaproteobacteria bacterium]